MRAALVSMIILALVVPLAPMATATTFEVSAFNGFWSPDALSIDVGDSVEFLLAEGFHNYVADVGGDTCELPCTRTFSDEGTVAFHCGIHPSMTGTITVGTPPVGAIATPAPGSTVSGLVHVEGSASHVTDSITSVTVRIDTGTAVAATLNGAGSSVTWSADVPSTSVTNGGHSLIARVTTSGGVFADSVIPIIVDNAPTVDIVLTAASAQQGATVTNLLSFVVRNDGNTPAEVTVLAEYLYHGTWRTIGSATTPVVGVGSSEQGTIVWSLASSPRVGAFPVRFTADPGELLPDPARANNVRSTTAGWFTNAVPGIVLTEPV